jgi:IS30 family transposase
MGQGRRVPLSQVERMDLWRRWRAGESLSDISRALGRKPGSIHGVLREQGGFAPRPRKRSARALAPGEREEISRGLAGGRTLRAIALELGRAPSTIGREVTRNGGRAAYRAERAEGRALGAGLRPKECLLAARPKLRLLVATKLRENWSPQQVSGWLRQRYPRDGSMRVSHETVYKSLFIQARGVLGRELLSHLRSRRMMRCAKVSSSTASRSSIPGLISIADRPKVVADREAPGHWEGDLISGAHNSHIATLVERRSRFLMLVRLQGKDTRSVVTALARRVNRLASGAMASLTWDRGAELASHQEFSASTGVPVYFCDPSSPWQRGTNENTNGLLRQYFPRRTDLSGATQSDLDRVARQMNRRPRKTLGYRSPADVLCDQIALTD